MAKTVLTEGQRSLLPSLFKKEDSVAPPLTEEEVVAIADGAIAPAFLPEEKLLSFLIVANGFYRAGVPLISDHEYDFIFLAALKKINPEHPFLHSVESEPIVEAKTIELPTRMLSTDKAYDFEAIKRWANRIKKAAISEGVDFESLVFRGTPKLDGFAAYDDGKTLYTRGDGRRGTDVTRAFDRGLQVAQNGKRGLGAGEIVVDRNYFAENLAEHFDNSRNIQASLLREKDLDPVIVQTVADGAAVFYPFVLLPDWFGSWSDLENSFEAVVDGLWDKVPYDIDGIVFEIVDEKLRQVMGATMHHHRWQIAFKRNTESAQVRVIRVVPQASRSGRINPVAEVEPTRLSGAEIRRVTAHHYGMVRDKGIGAGCLVEMTRSGEVIPKIERVIEPVDDVTGELPTECPSCKGDVYWQEDYLKCSNTLSCPAQVTNTIEHFFKTLGNVDGFGPSSIQKLYEFGVITLPEIYKMSIMQFEQAGFGPKQSENMVAQLRRSRNEMVEDSRFLAAFGLPRLGRGNCDKLLQYCPLAKVFDLSEEEIVENIKGFQGKTAEAICRGLASVKELFFDLYNLGFNLEITPLLTDQAELASPIAGKTIVFTGTMLAGSRGDMEKHAKSLGAKVGKSITGKTNILVAGAKVGASKMAKAEKLGVEVLSETDYQALLDS